METVADKLDMAAIVSLVKQGTTAVFEISGSAFDFISGNPLCLFMMGAGFAGFAISILRRALRAAKRA